MVIFAGLLVFGISDTARAEDCSKVPALLNFPVFVESGENTEVVSELWPLGETGLPDFSGKPLKQANLGAFYGLRLPDGQDRKLFELGVMETRCTEIIREDLAVMTFRLWSVRVPMVRTAAIKLRVTPSSNVYLSAQNADNQVVARLRLYKYGVQVGEERSIFPFSSAFLMNVAETFAIRDGEEGDYVLEVLFPVDSPVRVRAPRRSGRSEVYNGGAP
ncbi:MAG: hypothetical protein Q7S32_01550 [bacterium]|nr:hypothetical protein [bacterium]